jgi:uncharacterized membrane protein YeaQ/YmgE (transglycosylase-associated protein family)
MSVITWIIVGIIAGWLANRITGRDGGLFAKLAIGILGSIIGGFVFTSVIGFHYTEGLNLPSVLVATVGAVVLLGIFGGMRNRRPLS